MLGFIVPGNHFRPPETLLSLSVVWTNEGFYKQAYISVYLKLQECLITKANSITAIIMSEMGRQPKQTLNMAVSLPLKEE